MAKCDSCGAPNPPENTTCGYCRSPLPIRAADAAGPKIVRHYHNYNYGEDRCAGSEEPFRKESDVKPVPASRSERLGCWRILALIAFLPIYLSVFALKRESTAAKIFWGILAAACWFLYGWLYFSNRGIPLSLAPRTRALPRRRVESEIIAEKYATLSDCADSQNIRFGKRETDNAFEIAGRPFRVFVKTIKRPIFLSLKSGNGTDPDDARGGGVRENSERSANRRQNREQTRIS